MRTCPCGGHVRQHRLMQSREAWVCGSCGRYEVMGGPTLNGDQKPAGHEGWTCSIDFLMSEKGRIQVIEKTKESA